MGIHIEHPADVKNFLQHTKLIIQKTSFLEMLSNNLCCEHGFRDFEEFSDHPHHCRKVLIIPDCDGNYHLNSQGAFVILILELPCLFVPC